MKADGAARSTRNMKAALEGCLLALLADREDYGYELVKRLRRMGIDTVNEGSVYTLLRSFEGHGLLSSRLVQSRGGPARRHYALTPEGEHQLRRWSTEFLHFAHAVEAIVALSGLPLARSDSYRLSSSRPELPREKSRLD